MAGVLMGLVIEHVKSMTRFDEDDIVELAPEKVFEVDAELYFRQRLTCQWRRESGFGRLRLGVDRVGEHGLESELRSRLELCKNLLPKEIEKWAVSSHGEYRRLLHINHGINGVGYEKTCGICHGNSKVSCPKCQGSKETSCGDCQGRGKRTCGGIQGV